MEYKTEKANRESNFGEPAWYGLWRKGADDYWYYARTQYGINYTTEAHALPFSTVAVINELPGTNFPAGACAIVRFL